VLAAGARIAVVSPSGISDPDRLDRGIALARSWGFDLVELPHARAECRYLAGADDERLRDLHEAFSGRFDAVWAARGGYGLSRLMPRIQWASLAPVPFIGFSDATSLLNGLAARGRPAIHGPVLHALDGYHDEESRLAIRAVLAGEPVRFAGRPLVPGRAEGPLCGGNLCILASLCGTPYQLDAHGKIVLLEDLGEPPYKLDRLLVQCRDAGVFDGAVGFVLGDFLDARPPADAAWTVDDVLLDILGPLGVPILADLPVGHGRRNLAVPLGTRARLHASVLAVEPA